MFRAFFMKHFAAVPQNMKYSLQCTVLRAMKRSLTASFRLRIKLRQDKEQGIRRKGEARSKPERQQRQPSQ